MFRCADCNEVSVPGDSSCMYVVSYRTKYYGKMPKYDRGKRAKVPTNVYGKEIEGVVGPLCIQCCDRRSEIDAEKKGIEGKGN